MKHSPQLMLIVTLCCVIPIATGCSRPTGSQADPTDTPEGVEFDSTSPQTIDDSGSADGGDSQAGPQSAVATDDETPQEAIALFQQLLSDGDYETLVRERYGERSRVPADELDKMISEFETRLKERFADVLERAQSMEPEMSSDANKAVYKGDGMMFILKKDENGKWNFDM